MKNWSQFKNWLMALLACEVILLVLCFLYARAIILEQILFLALACLQCWYYLTFCLLGPLS